MVSTRGVKFKFTEGEKVLCYEPDPTKAKVLYDSKVLEVIVNKDNRGRKCVEYLIHFQGWNSSWDRCVGEDYVLKDTDDNRRLQRNLSDKAQLQLCSNSYLPAYNSRRERKQQARRRKTSDRTSDGADDGSSGGVRRKRRKIVGGGKRRAGDEGSSGCDGEEDDDGDGEDGGEADFSSEDEDEDEDEGGDEEEEQDEENDIEGKVLLNLSDNIKKILEEDGELITCKNKLIRLPASPNVVSILESFMKQYALNQLFPATLSPDKRKKQPRNQHHHIHSNGRGSCRPKDINKAIKCLNLCKEVVDGLRIYFDHTLSGLLLYAQEKEQYEEEVASLASLSNSFRGEGRSGSASNKCTPSKFQIKQEQTNSCDSIQRSSTEDFFSVQVKEEPKVSFGDSDKEMTESMDEICLKNTFIEEESFHSEKNIEDKGTKRCDRHKENYSDYKDDSYKNSRIDCLGDIKSEVITSLSGTFHNTMSSAASTSSCCSTPSCITSSNRPISHLLPPSMNERTSSINSMSISPSENALLKRIMNWKMIPDMAGVTNAPSQLYGATHLARLFVKLPDLLNAAGIHEKKLKVLLGYLHTFLEYLEEHTDWFGESHYKENISALI